MQSEKLADEAQLTVPIVAAMPDPLPGEAWTQRDAHLCMLLAAQQHKTDRAVKAAALRAASRLPKMYRHYPLSVANARSPLKHLKAFCRTRHAEAFFKK